MKMRRRSASCLCFFALVACDAGSTRVLLDLSAVSRAAPQQVDGLSLTVTSADGTVITTETLGRDATTFELELRAGPRRTFTLVGLAALPNGGGTFEAIRGEASADLPAGRTIEVVIPVFRYGVLNLSMIGESPRGEVSGTVPLPDGFEVTLTRTEPVDGAAVAATVTLTEGAGSATLLAGTYFINASLPSQLDSLFPTLNEAAPGVVTVTPGEQTELSAVLLPAGERCFIGGDYFNTLPTCRKVTMKVVGLDCDGFVDVALQDGPLYEDFSFPDGQICLSTDCTLPGNCEQEFESGLGEGTPYTFEVAYQPFEGAPVPQYCRVESPSGVVGTSDIQVRVTCDSNPRVWGYVHGLEGTGLRITNTTLGDSTTLSELESLGYSSSGSQTYVLPATLTASTLYTLSLTNPTHPAGPTNCGFVDGSSVLSSVGVSPSVGEFPQADISCAGPVRPFYAAAPAILDWITMQPGQDALHATDAPCPAGGTSACLHAGIMRGFPLKSAYDCYYVSNVYDALGAFDWQCMVKDPYGPNHQVWVVATGFKPDQGMGTLIDTSNPSSPTWRTNAVYVEDETQTYPPTITAATRWWSTPLVVANNASVAPSQSRTIYVVTQASTRTFAINGTNNVGIVIANGVTLAPTSASIIPVSVNNAAFAWVEGRIDASQSSPYAVNVGTAAYGTVHRANVQTGGIRLERARHYIVRDATVYDSSGHGVEVGSQSSHVHIDGANVAGATNGFLVSASHVTLTNVAAAGNDKGIVLQGSGQLSDVTVAKARLNNNVVVGLSASNVTNARLSELLVTNNGAAASTGYGGVHLSVFSHSVVRDVTSARNAGTVGDFSCDTCANNRLSSIAAMEGDTGLTLLEPTGNAIWDVVIGPDTSFNVTYSAANPGGNTFSGELLGDPACTVTAPNDPALQTLCSLVSMGSYHLDEATTYIVPGDSKHTGQEFDQDSAAFATAAKWLDFENPYRAWSTSEPIPGPCASSCNITEYRVIDDGFGIGHLAAGYAVSFSTPEVEDHVWDVTAASQADCDQAVPGSVFQTPPGACVTTYLRYALELQGDGRGNDNGLCEPGERCVEASNIGAHQGEGLDETTYYDIYVGSAPDPVELYYYSTTFELVIPG